MLQIVKGYTLVVYVPAQGEQFDQRRLQVLLQAEGPYAERDGHEAALARIDGHVGPFLKKSWAMRWLAETPAERTRAEQAGHRFVAGLSGRTPAALAEHLLLAAFEPLLRGQGLLVREVSVTLEGVAEPGFASVPQDIAKAYEAEMDYRPLASVMRSSLRPPSPAEDADKERALQDKYDSSRRFNKRGMTAGPRLTSPAAN